MRYLNRIAAAASLLLLFSCGHQAGDRFLEVIPYPAHVEMGTGYLSGYPELKLISSVDSLNLTAAFRNAFPEGEAENAERFPLSVEVAGEASGASSVDLPGEGYALEITRDGIRVEASTAAGAFYALQTLSQLSGPEGFPLCRIEDAPRFGYRGLMLDVSRNFYDKDFVKKQIDRIASYKINRLHLHLTDAAGWRIEIDGYPELTRQAAWRAGRTWEDWREQGYRYLHEGDSCASGGYYTKADLKEIVDYAAERYITVIPEIEMPSHSEEVLTVYPELSCTHEPYRQADFCPGNEQVYRFLEDVVDEVTEIFPSPYLHIGGDEASKRSWSDCPLCRRRMAEEGLTDVDALQTYFMNRMIRYVRSKGRIPIGWDEIYVEGDLDSSASVMVWRNKATGAAAASEGYDVIMTPGEFCYFDTYQDAPTSLPAAMGGYLPLEKVYSYDPLPDTLSAAAAAHILGLQANLWTEYVPEEAHAELMIYPRLLAIAEVGWTPSASKSFERFRSVVLRETSRMESEGYSPFDIRHEIGDRPEFLERIDHKARGCRVHYNAAYYPDYSAGGDTALVDGYRGNWTYHDGRWQGLIRPDRLNVVIDLGAETSISSVSADFMQVCGPEVYFPSAFSVEISSDGESFHEIYSTSLPAAKDNRVRFERLGWSGSASCRYVRVKASASPFGGFIFTDEIVVM